MKLCFTEESSEVGWDNRLQQYCGFENEEIELPLSADLSSEQNIPSATTSTPTLAPRSVFQ